MVTLAGLWIAWCALHSILISRGAHRFAERLLGDKAGTYRILYVLISIVTLLPLLAYQFTLPQHIIVKSNGAILLLQFFLFFYGLLMLYLGARVYDMSFFLGITQWRSMQHNTKPATLPFHTDGVLAYVRHPWYSGGIALIWGFGAITDIYLVTRLILTAYFILGTLHEEKRMVNELGSRYTAYRKKVPMLVPWKLRK